MLGVAVCASCAVVVGLEDKEPYPIETSEAGTPAEDVSRPDTSGEPQADGGDGGFEGGGEVIVFDQASPYGVVVDEAYVYWTNEANGKVMRRVKTLAAPPEVFVEGQPQPQHMLVDNSYVY